jgi:flagellar biosynthetic protein FliO
MNLTKHRKTALVLAALILLGGALLFAFPASQPIDAVQQAPSAQPIPSTQQVPTVESDYGSMLLKMIISVALVCLLAYAILRWGLGRLVGATPANGEMEILSQLGLGPNRSIMVVRVGPRFLVIGSTETGISLLSELSSEEAADFDLSQVPDK